MLDGDSNTLTHFQTHLCVLPLIENMHLKHFFSLLALSGAGLSEQNTDSTIANSTHAINHNQHAVLPTQHSSEASTSTRPTMIQGGSANRKDGTFDDQPRHPSPVRRSGKSRSSSSALTPFYAPTDQLPAKPTDSSNASDHLSFERQWNGHFPAISHCARTSELPEQWIPYCAYESDPWSRYLCCRRLAAYVRFVCAVLLS